MNTDVESDAPVVSAASACGTAFSGAGRSSITACAAARSSSGKPSAHTSRCATLTAPLSPCVCITASPRASPFQYSSSSYKLHRLLYCYCTSTIMSNATVIIQTVQSWKFRSKYLYLENLLCTVINLRNCA